MSRRRSSRAGCGTPTIPAASVRPLSPLRLQLRRPAQRLEDHAVLLRLAPQVVQLLLGSSGSDDVEPGADALEAHANLLRDAKSSGEVQLTLDFDLDALGLYPHRLGNHLAGDLGAGRQGAEQEITGAGGGAGSSDPGVG